ncbi:MAG: carboxypeptidase-like regulatory domain-containing protein, partial [Flavobacteriales bacterium]
MKYLLICCLMLTLVGISQGQSKFTVSGEVSDKSSGETLIGAALFVNGTGVAISNEYGFYSFDLPGGIFTIEIKYIGLETKLVEIDLKA